MKKRVISIIILMIYIVILIEVMVFKVIPEIKIGSLMLNFGGPESVHPANFIPFTTIVPYLLGYKGWIIAGINLIGNIAPLVPIGLLAPFIYRNINWKKSLVLGIVSGLIIEILQTILHVGIFDIDDVILNALGVMIGFWIVVIVARWLREKKYKQIVIAAIIVIAAVAALYAFVIHPLGQQPVTQPGMSGDLCGGTGGIGQIVSVGNNTLTLKRKDGTSQIVTFTDHVMIQTTAGTEPASVLNIGDYVTLVGGPNPDGSFAADTIVVCTMRTP